MILKCLWCDYQKEKPLSQAILNILAEEDLPQEDYNLWLERLVVDNGSKNYASVKIHMGKMHKESHFKFCAPEIILSPEEEKTLQWLQ